MKHRCKLLFATILSALCLAGPASATKPAVVDQTALNGFQDYLDKHLPEPMKAAMVQRGLAAWGMTRGMRVQKNGYCLAVLGITVASPDQRMARSPLKTLTNLTRYDNVGENWDSADCRAETLRDTVEALGKSTLPTAEDVNKMLATGGVRQKEKADSGMVWLQSYNVSTGAEAATFRTIHGYDLGATADYRQVQAVLYAFSFNLQGENICFAEFGLSARAPSGRQARIPAEHSGGMYAGGDKATCERVAAEGAVQAHFDQPWNSKGVFKDFEKTREDGVALPDLGAVAKKRTALAAKAAAAEKQVRSTQRNVVRCSNVCTNGNCVRTFENGRKERWQAPRVYDPFKNDWTWDTNSCGQ